MSPDQTPSGQHRRDIELQGIIDALAASGEGRPVDDIISDLRERLHQQGLPAMPQTWVRAVATQAAVGNPYVVSRLTAEDLPVPKPDNPDQPYSIT
ncbi:hypothetical protein [Lapillicoccus sp.]|uniref:hypothetical protein n=1 Tax=Lapillicoccus sp. TaxID=1909287 RepID=UPI0032662DDC